MSDLGARLERALDAQAPAAPGPMFRVEIMLRRQRRLFRQQLVRSGAIALGAAILAPLGLAAISELTEPGALRLAIVAASAALLTAFLAAPHLGAGPALRRLARSWPLRY